MNKFESANIKQYEQIFGREKMRALWAEFVSDAATKLKVIEVQDSESQRLAYHSLRSSSQVFGLMMFSETCQKREEEILAGTLITPEKAFADKQLLNESMAEVETYLS